MIVIGSTVLQKQTAENDAKADVVAFSMDLTYKLGCLRAD